jgi:hypothetical protein
MRWRAAKFTSEIDSLAAAELGPRGGGRTDGKARVDGCVRELSETVWEYIRASPAVIAEN